MKMKTDETHEEKKKRTNKQPNAAVKWDFSANAAPATQSQVQSLHWNGIWEGGITRTWRGKGAAGP